MMTTHRRHYGLAFALLGAGLALGVVAGNGLLPASAMAVLHAYAFGLVFGLLGALGLWRVSSRVPAGARAGLALSAALGGTAVGGTVLLGVNKLADGSPGVPHAGRIVKKSLLSNAKGSSQYDRTSLRNTVSVPSWFEEGKLIEVHVVGVERWTKLSPGDEISVTAHDGRLGWPWVEAYAGPP